MTLNKTISAFVVEDEVDLREEVVASLTRNGFSARGFPGSRELYRALLGSPCDVVVLDIGLPGEDGFAIMEHLRGATSVGIVMLTARGQIDDRIRALRGGADAYLVKPVDLEELAATLLSVVRRVRGKTEDDGGEPSGGTSWQLTQDNWFLVAPTGARVPLSASERALLQALLLDPGAVVSRDALVEAAGYHPDEVISNRLDMTVSRLRRKVSEHTGLSLPLRSLRGVGFALMHTGEIR